MSLSSPDVINELRREFVCGVYDISGTPWVGKSDKHETNALAVKTTNGAGAHNIQMFFLSADGTVVHCLLGYWAPQDFLEEAKLASTLNQVWLSPRYSRAQKDAIFRQLQLAHINAHSKEMSERSKLQSFDEHHERSRPDSDFVVAEGSNPPRSYVSNGTRFKTVDEVLHERMSCYPFVQYSKFDVTAYSDFGARWYDKHENHTQQQLVQVEQQKEDADRALAGGYFVDPREANRMQMRSEREQERLDQILSQVDGRLEAKDQSAVDSHFASIQSLSASVKPHQAPVLHNALARGMNQRLAPGRGVQSYNWSAQNGASSGGATGQTAYVPATTRLSPASQGTHGPLELSAQQMKLSPQGLIAEVQQLNQSGLTATAQTMAPVATVHGKRITTGNTGN